MFLTIAAIIFLLWLLGLIAFHSIGAWIHILLIVAIIIVIYDLVARRRV